MNCPKCGAEEGVAGNIYQWFKCNSTVSRDGGTNFGQSNKCKLACAEKRIKKLEDALRPIVKSAPTISGPDGVRLFFGLTAGYHDSGISLGHLRQAAKLIEKQQEEKE